jgi:hypothetical protein
MRSKGSLQRTFHPLMTESFIATASQTDFVLARTPIAILVNPAIDGVHVHSSNWTIETATVTFAVGVTKGAEVVIDYLY